MIPAPLDSRKPFVLQYDKRVSRWRTFREPQRFDPCWGIILLGGPDWSLHIYLGKWLVGLERTSAVS